MSIKYPKHSGIKKPSIRASEGERRRYWEPEPKVAGGTLDELLKKLDRIDRERTAHS